MKPLTLLLLLSAACGSLYGQGKPKKSRSKVLTCVNHTSVIDRLCDTCIIGFPSHVITIDNVTGQDSITFRYDTIPAMIFYADTTTLYTASVKVKWYTNAAPTYDTTWSRSDVTIRWLNGYYLKQRIIPGEWIDPRKRYLDGDKKPLPDNFIILKL